MSAVTTNPDLIRDTFVNLTIDKIQGEPTYETLMALNIQLNANATSIGTLLSTLGYLALTCLPALFTRLNGGTPWTEPTNPGLNPTMPNANPTQAQITQVNREWANEINEWRMYMMMEKLLKQQLIGAIEEMYIRSLRSKIVGYANVTTRDLLTHLF